MKLARRLVTLAIVLAMVMAFMIPTAMAASTPSITINANNPAATGSLEINYTWYKILSADIGVDGTVDPETGAANGGQVAYYVTDKEQADALKATNLFTVEQVASGADEWYVKLVADKTAEDIVSALSNPSFPLAEFATGTFTTTKTGNDISATTTVDAGYYYIVSDLGTKVALQTLTDVTINEKNSYPTISKNYNADTDALAGINDVVTYTIKVNIPATVAEEDIVLVDTISDGLTLNTEVTVTGAVESPVYTSAEFGETNTDNVYKLIIPAATVKANADKELIFTYTATVNEKAAVLEAESNIIHLKYSGYTTVDTAAVETKTLAFTVQKIDGANKDQLTGAEFSLWTAAQGGTMINLVKVTDREDVYRVATEAEATAANFVSAPVEAGVATIEGLNDITYYLQEDKAPTGYNKLAERKAIAVTAGTAAPSENIVDIQVENNTGLVLPSTGGIGTTIFYVLGGVLFLGALVILFTNKRMRQN